MKRIIQTTTFILLISAAIFLSSCAETYQLTVSESSGGSVSMSPSGGAYSEGTTVTLTAVPESGYSFTGWGNISEYSSDYSVEKEIEIVMPAQSLEISAVFSVPNEGWTFMIYMAGDNDLSSYVTLDINEIEQGLYDAVAVGNSEINGVVRVLVLADRSGSSNTNLYLIEPDNTDAIASSTLSASFNSSGELNMADPDNLENFVSYCLANFPSEYNALVIWNHGGGARSLENTTEITSKEICEDGDDIIYMNELQTALESAVGSPKLNIIGMDACIMGEVETAYEMRTVADYFVASMGEEWGYGWSYDNIFNEFISEDSPPTVAEMADILVGQYYDSTINNSKYALPHTMTAVKTSELETLKTEIDSLAELIHIDSDSSDPQTEFQDQRDNTVPYYGDESNILSYPYYDIYDFCTNIVSSNFGADVQIQASAVITALDSAVVACYGNTETVDSAYSYAPYPMGLDYYETDDSAAVRGLSIMIPNGELTYDGYSHYAYDWWYSTEINSPSSDPSIDMGGIDFCDSDTDGTVETWRELFEAWYDDGDTNYTPGSY